MKKVSVYTNTATPEDEPLFSVTLTEDDMLVVEEFMPNSVELFFPFNPQLTPASRAKEMFAKIATYPYYGMHQHVEYENTDYAEVAEWANAIAGEKPVAPAPKEDLTKSQSNIFRRFFGA